MDNYTKISSFEDFKNEKERLSLNKKLVEMKIKYGILFIRKNLSISNLISAFLKHKE